MGKPCAVFWDIQNVGIPRGQSANSIIKLIRSTIIKPHNLNEIFFFCVCDVHKLSSNVGQSLINLDVDIVQAYNRIKDSADIKIMDLMRKFVKVAGQDCTIILLSGDADYYGILSDLKKLHNVSVHLVRLANSWSPKLEQIADYTFMLNNGVLKPVKSTGSPKYFISVKNYPLSINISQVMYELNAQAIGSIRNSAILHINSICIGFPTLFNAESAIKRLNRSRYHRHFLKVELINESPLTKILKYSKPQTKGREVKTLTFVKSEQFLESTAVPVPAPIPDGQCILSSESFLWIVFSFKSDAQKCLPKVQETYPDAVISEPPIDLTYASNESPYTVKLYKQKSTQNPTQNSTVISDLKPNKPEKLANLKVNESKMLNLFNRFSFILNSHDLKLSDKITTLNELVTLNGEDNLNSNYRAQVQWKLVFCHNPEISSHLTTKWSLIHNLFAQFYHLGARKVCFDGNLYWVQFDCKESYESARNKSRALNLESLELISPTCKQSHLTEIALHETTDEMHRYNFDNPWCFLPALELYCYVICMNSEFHADFIERNKNQLSMCECIFIKSFSGEIWLGFPDKRICKEYEKYVNELFFHSWKRTKPITMAQPSKKLLESIELEDLIGEAYDLAFLSNELIISRKLSEYKNSKIIQKFSFEFPPLVKTEHGSDKPLFYLTVSGLRPNVPHQPLEIPKIVKILVKFGKVIPIAAMASMVQSPTWSFTTYSEMFISFFLSSWVELQTMSHYLTNSKLDYIIDKPYTDPKVEEDGLLTKEKLNTFDYYIINDQRKVLVKIVQNKNQVDKLDSNSSTVQSTSDIYILDEGIMRQLQYLYTITTDSDFKFTNGMISIIKMNLVQMDCPVCIEFEGKVWVGVDDLKKGNKAKARIDQIKFKMLHEYDENDIDVRLRMNLITCFPLKVKQIMAKKLINSTQNDYKECDFTKCDIKSYVPLRHFNYCFKKVMKIDCFHS